MILKTVRVNKKDTCLSYVLKRVGIKSKTEFAKDIEKSMLVPFDINTVEVGKIVVWESKKTHYLYSTEIKTIAGKPSVIRNHEFVALHFGVIEVIDKINGEDVITVSDCIRNSNCHSHPTIMLSTITKEEKTKDTESRIPEYYLNFKKLENG